MEDNSVDIILWGARGYPGAIRSPEKYGWIDIDDETGYVKKVLLTICINTIHVYY